MKTNVIWAPVRRGDDGEFFVTSEIGFYHSEAASKAHASSENIPSWHKANPVQRIARFSVTETPL